MKRNNVMGVFLMVVAPALALFLALLGLETLRTNILGWFLLVFGVAYPAGGVIYYFIRREPFWRMGSIQFIVQEEKGDRSFWAILPGFLAIFFAPPLEWLYLPAWLPRSLWMMVAGLILVPAGIVLGTWARFHIRNLYSGHVEIGREHRLIQSGPYRFLRHPNYSAFVLMALGLAIGYSSWIGLAAIPILLVPGLAYRMSVEEHLLSRHFGEEYRDYIRKSKKMIPGIW